MKFATFSVWYDLREYDVKVQKFFFFVLGKWSRDTFMKKSFT